MKSKINLILIVFLFILSLVLLTKVLDLKLKYNDLSNRVRSYTVSELISCISEKNKIDSSKLLTGDKTSILQLINMHVHVSNANTVTVSSYRFNDAIYYDGLDNYNMALRDIVDKAINGKLENEDISRLNIITEDIKVLYKYIEKADQLDKDYFYKEVKLKLKLN